MRDSGRDIADFYRDLADRLAAVPGELPRGTLISEELAAFLTNAAREIREDANTIAKRISDFDPVHRWAMLKDDAERAQKVQSQYSRFSLRV
ncbi:MAG TPA: hypothetical protein VHT51_18660 [Micropepsaceae bacterium]|jgi:hypothetical protein|nr:hypothetical protein [Micropepsaceae bacterium]